ncbi:LysR family transcriptional regulator [Streptomyces sp. NPDC050738]|uniref:LysR family transcriptional regulator n=1 Tax=Streptomyces sp. NPDC050738 TaxID=3154744 RepID=UPI0034494ACE
MDTHLLRTFTAVVDHGSFSEAARVLGYTQSAVSQHIAALEADLATPLLTRRPVAPTEAGARLLEHARPLLLRLDAARADMARLGAGPAKTLTVGCTPLALTGRLAALLPSGSTVRMVSRAEVAGAVMAGEADLGFVDGAAAPSDPLPVPDADALTTAPVAEEPLAVLLPAGHPLATRSAVGLSDLADAHWIDAPDTGIPLAQLRATARVDGFRPYTVIDGTDVLALGALVAAGHGLTVLPATVAEALPGTVAIRIVTPRIAHRTEVLHTRLGEGGPARALIAALAQPWRVSPRPA